MRRGVRRIVHSLKPRLKRSPVGPMLMRIRRSCGRHVVRIASSSIIPASLTTRANASHAYVLTFTVAEGRWAEAVVVGEALLARAGSGASPAWFRQVATAHLKLGNHTGADR